MIAEILSGCRDILLMRQEKNLKHRVKNMINEVIYMAIQVIYSACQEKKSAIEENKLSARVFLSNCHDIFLNRQDILSERYALG